MTLVSDLDAIRALLNKLHATATKGDVESYLACFSPAAVFIGTDATEYWHIDEFSVLCKKLFAEGKNWTYVPIEASRRFAITSNRSGWFYEHLTHAKYGEVRATGVAEIVNGNWAIAQYVLTLPIPNDLFDDVTTIVRGWHLLRGRVV